VRAETLSRSETQPFIKARRKGNMAGGSVGVFWRSANLKSLELYAYFNALNPASQLPY
jgi:hypothetical protein